MTSTLEDMSLILPYFFGEDPHDPTTCGAKPFQTALPAARPRLKAQNSNATIASIAAAVVAADGI
jgi:hypothetical protein